MIFFFEKFGYAWGTHAEVPQEYKYLKRIRYGYDSIFGVSVFHRSIHPGQAIKNLDKFLWMG